MTTKLSLNMSNVNCRAEPPQIKNCWPRSSKLNLSWVENQWFRMGKQRRAPAASWEWNPLFWTFSPVLTPSPGWPELPTTVWFCFPTLSLLIALSLACLFHEAVSREGQTMLSCLMLSVMPTSRMESHLGLLEVILCVYPCCGLPAGCSQEANLEALSSGSGESERTSRGSWELVVSTPSSHYPHTQRSWVSPLPRGMSPCWGLRSSQSWGETGLETDVLNPLGSR